MKVTELWVHIFSFLSPMDLCVCCCVCKEWNEICSSDHLWVPILYNQIGRKTNIVHLPYTRTIDNWKYDVTVDAPFTAKIQVRNIHPALDHEIHWIDLDKHVIHNYCPADMMKGERICIHSSYFDTHPVEICDNRIGYVVGKDNKYYFEWTFWNSVVATDLISVESMIDGIRRRHRYDTPVATASFRISAWECCICNAAHGPGVPLKKCEISKDICKMCKFEPSPVKKTMTYCCHLCLAQVERSHQPTFICYHCQRDLDNPMVRRVTSDVPLNKGIDAEFKCVPGGVYIGPYKMSLPPKRKRN